MKLQIDIYQRRGGNMHVILRGRAGSEASSGDSDAFARYIKICQEFTRRHTPLTEVLVAPSRAEGELHMTSPVSG